MTQTKQIICSLLFAAGLWQLAAGGYIYAKAELAQWLIAKAWDETLEGKQSASEGVKPWQSADTWPLAKLIWPKHQVEMMILQGSSGRTLAFGPGHMSNTPKPGEQGNSVVGGHRDTHFSFLAQVKEGEVFTIQTPDNQLQRYQVYRQFVVDHRDVEPVLALDSAFDQMTFVTCYPFDAITTGGPLRYVVMAKKISLEQPNRQPEQTSSSATLMAALE